MLCDLALAIQKEITPEFNKRVPQCAMVDVGSKECVMRHA